METGRMGRREFLATSRHLVCATWNDRDDGWSTRSVQRSTWHLQYLHAPKMTIKLWH